MLADDALPPAVSAAAAASARGAWRAVAILFLANLFCTADQVLPRLFIDPIKASFSLTDTQVALLVGFSFSLSISIFALPLSWIADRWNRARLLAAGIVVWCLATLTCAFCHSFWSLFLLRMGVGLGEAALKPAMYSLLADLFAPQRLARPMAVLGLSALMGEVVAFNGGGWLFEAMQTNSVIGSHTQDFAWRATMFAIGALGLVVGIAALWLPEPRRAVGNYDLGRRNGMGLSEYLRASAFFLVPFVGAMVLVALFVAGYSGWVAPFFARSYGWSIGRIGQALGSIGLVCGILGLPLGIWITGAARRRLKRDAPVAAVGFLLAVGAPAIVLSTLAGRPWVSLLAFAAFQLPAAAATVVVPIVWTEMAPPHLRARVIAVAGLVLGICGTAAGPVVYGAATDLVFHDPSRLGYAMAALSGVLTLMFLPLLVLADRRFLAVRILAEHRVGTSTDAECGT